jgi:RimJ/RimL family protein N-acetyltransferase
MSKEYPIGDLLPDDLIALSRSLPVKPDPVTLEGRFVKLIPMDPERDAAPLLSVADGQAATLGDRSIDAYDPDALIWAYLGFGPFKPGDVEGMQSYLETIYNIPDSLAMVAIHQPTGRQVGIATFMSNSPANLKIELGNIWYSPLVQGTPINTESTYLMARHCFELGYQRLEWKCNACNMRSRRTAERMGFVFEGVQDSHMVVKGRNRDTAWFRILAKEWPEKAARLEAMLESWT